MVCVHYDLDNLEGGWIFIPREHVQQGVKQSGFVHLFVSTKIARSWDLGIWVTLKYNISVDIVEKLVSLCFESLPMRVAKNFILLATPMDTTHYRPCALCSCAQSGIYSVLWYSLVHLPTSACSIPPQARCLPLKTRNGGINLVAPKKCNTVRLTAQLLFLKIPLNLKFMWLD